MRTLVAVAALAVPAAAAAHPMGNFSVNRHATVAIERDRVRVDYLLDLAEVPAAIEIRGADANSDGALSDAEKEAWLDRRVPEILAKMRIERDGAALSPHAGFRIVETPAGQGGALTLRCVLEIVAASRGGSTGRVRFVDDNVRDRRGWHEIVPEAGEGIEILESSVPRTGSAAGTYVEGAPIPEENEATIRFRAGGGGAVAHERTSAARGEAPDGDARMTRFLRGGRLTFGMLVFALAMATLLGAGHALSPGHGKTLVGAYLVGSRGKPRHAVSLGLIVTFTHTVSVFLLGVVALYASRYVLPERLYPWLGFASGLLIVAIGVAQLPGRLRRMKGKGEEHPREKVGAGATEGDFVKIAPAEGGGAHRHVHRLADGTEVEHVHEHEHVDVHDHEHDHDHDGEDGHGHEHGDGPGQHRHLPRWGVEASVGVKVRELVALGVSGGIVPCPSALVVLLTAISLHRIGLGLLLIVAFSVGLAATLTAIGLLVVWGSRIFDRFGGGRFVRVVPVGSTILIIVIGAGIAWRAMATGAV